MIKKIFTGSRFRTALSFIGLCLLAGVVLSYSEQVSSHSSTSSNGDAAESSKAVSTVGSLWSIVGRTPKVKEDSQTGTLEKMIVEKGNVDMQFDLRKLNGGKSIDSPRQPT